MPFLSWIINVFLGTLCTCVIFGLFKNGSYENGLDLYIPVIIGCFATAWPALIVEWLGYWMIKRKKISYITKRKIFFIFRCVFEAFYLILILFFLYLHYGVENDSVEKSISFFLGYFIPMMALHPVLFPLPRFKTQNEIDKKLNSSDQILDDFI